MADVYVVLHEVPMDCKAGMSFYSAWFSLGLYIESRGNTWTTWTFE